MNDDVPETLPAVSTSAVGAPPHQLPLDFEAFYVVNVAAFHDYAEVSLGNRAEAEELVHRAFLEILGNWQSLLADGNLEQRAWAIVRRAVSRRLEGDDRPPALAINGPILRALRAGLMSSARQQMSLMESSRGLYAAIAALPNRQFDVMVLKYILGYGSPRIAWLLGLKNERTVDYHLRRAKERLSRDLGLEPNRKGARP